jgi:Fic family protein
METYIHQQNEWPNFHWNDMEIIAILGEVSVLQGKLLGKIELLGFELKNEANLENIFLDVIRTSEIEGEILNPISVRSSIANRLGLSFGGIEKTDRLVEGIVDLMFDATQNENKTLTEDRLFTWHSSLFSFGGSNMYKMEIGQWRTGGMQVISGAMGREKVHFEAPKAERLSIEMKQFIQWFNADNGINSLIKAAIAHIWFITIHPFDDGNGRIARAITDLQLSKADGVNQRFYSMSSEINRQKKAYYAILEKTQKNTLDITQWLDWFLNCLKNSIISSHLIIDKVIWKHQFWAKNAHLTFNHRQTKVINMLMDHFEGNLTSSKWAKISKTSADTALRDITDLIQKGILSKSKSSGRSTNYTLIKEP